MHEITVSIIIVSWNIRELLARSLCSLFEHMGPIPYEVFVVDNDSSDGTCEELRREYPQVKLIQNQDNVGFSRANNQAIRLSRGRYILLVNPDTLWIDNSLKRMVDFMEVHPELGVLGPKLLNADRRTIQFEGARRLPLPLDTFFEYTRLSALFPHNSWSGRYLMGEWDHTGSRTVECLSGACLLIRHEVFTKVGELDEGYPLNFEDIDWCHRVGLSYWKLYYLAEAQIVHLGRQSILQNHGPSTVNAVRGVYRYYSKFFGSVVVRWAWLLILSASIAKLFVWSVVLLFRPGKREFALGRIKTFWKVLWISPHAF